MGEVPLYASAFNAPCEKWGGRGGADPGQSEVEFARAGCVRVQGYLAHKTTLAPQGPPQDPRQRPTLGSQRGGGFL